MQPSCRRKRRRSAPQPHTRLFHQCPHFVSSRTRVDQASCEGNGKRPAQLTKSETPKRPQKDSNESDWPDRNDNSRQREVTPLRRQSQTKGFQRAHKPALHQLRPPRPLGVRRPVGLVCSKWMASLHAVETQPHRCSTTRTADSRPKEKARLPCSWRTGWTLRSNRNSSPRPPSQRRSSSRARKKQQQAGITISMGQTSQNGNQPRLDGSKRTHHGILPPWRSRRREVTPLRRFSLTNGNGQPL